MTAPPTDPGTMTPQSKAALGSSLGLNGSPAPTEGSGTVSNNNLSSVDVGAVAAEMGDAHAEVAAMESEVREVLLESPAGSSATEGYHFDQQSEALRENESPLPVGPVPAMPPPTDRA